LRRQKENTLKNTDNDKGFTGLIPRFYEDYLVPLIFEPYAALIANLVAARAPDRVLEIAAGTGVVTRRLAAALEKGVSIVASDLSQPMLDLASKIGTARPVEWRKANAMQLPFADGAFDVVVCQFAAMFFPDKPMAFSEARRVLRPGGVFIFNVWDRIEENEFADIVTTSLETFFPKDPPRFLARTPHGYHDPARMLQDLRAGGFTCVPQIDTVAARSKAKSCRDPAIAYCQGTPLRGEIEARRIEAQRSGAQDKSLLNEATDTAAAAIERRFGGGAVDGKIQAHIVVIES
jgi:SAM-dependent methyltransferase